MLILDEYDLLIMLPQKCGSETLQHRLKEYHSCAGIGSRPFYHPAAKRYLSKHISYRMARRLPEFKERKRYHKACFVRNPYDRVYSWFQWVRQKSQEPMPDSNLPQLYAVCRHFEEDPKCLERSQRLRMRLREKLENAGGEFHRFIELYPKHFSPVSKFTHFLRRGRMDFIGYLERFEEDYSRLCDQFNLPETTRVDGNVLARPLSSANPFSMRRKDYKSLDYHDQSTIKYVNRRFKSDFDNFGYERLNPADFPERLD